LTRTNVFMTTFIPRRVECLRSSPIHLGQMKQPLKLATILLALLFPIIASALDTKLNAVKEIFRSENIEGTFIAASVNGKMRETFNPKRSETRFSPASTFKILNTLVGLKYGVISSSKPSFKWDGVERGVPQWNKDHSLASAFKVSCVWCYQEIANDVGISRYIKELHNTSFGNQNVNEPVDLHWLNGTLKVSAVEQITFLKKLVNNTLPYHREHIDTLKEIMLVEKNSDYTLFAKSGWVGPPLSTGWYVGYLETNDDTFVFAMNMVMDNVMHAPLRKELTMRSLKALKLI